MPPPFTTTGSVAGYGFSTGNQLLPSSVLRVANMQVEGNRNCESLFGQQLKTKFCAYKAQNSSGATNVCAGDVGAALYGRLINSNTDVLFGIASTIYKYCNDNVSSAYTNVPEYVFWISILTGIPVDRQWWSLMYFCINIPK